MHQAFEHCHYHRDVPQQSDSLASMCWPIIQQQKPLTVLEKAALSSRPPRNDVNWPVSEPWRRNLQQPRCGGQGRCQGDPQVCNSKYRYGVDDVGPCPSEASCRQAYCCAPCPPECVNPCPAPAGCNRQARPRRADCVFPVNSQTDRRHLYHPIQACDPRLTTRCFDWPIPRKDVCPPIETNADMRQNRADLNDQSKQPERCPTCKRIVVDLECGPLAYNY